MSGCSSLCVTFGRYDHGHRDICMYLYRHPFTQFYFRTTQKCKRYLKLALKYLVLFRRRNVSLVPFGAILTLPPPPWDFATTISAEEGKSGSSRASEHHQNYDSFSAPERITKIYQLQAKIHPAHSQASPTLTTVYKWKRCLQRLKQTRPQEHNRTHQRLRHRHLERIHSQLLEQLRQPLPERMQR